MQTPEMQTPTHTVVRKATVRSGPALKSGVVGTMQPGQHVNVFETQKKDGHLRARVGPSEWISQTTKIGSHLIVPFAPQAQTFAVRHDVAAAWQRTPRQLSRTHTALLRYAQIVNTTTVRKAISLDSKQQFTLDPGDTVAVLEEGQADGHHRVRIGGNEWMSIRTAKGAVLAVPTSSMMAAATAAPVVSVAVSVVVVAQQQPAVMATAVPEDYQVVQAQSAEGIQAKVTLAAPAGGGADGLSTRRDHPAVDADGLLDGIDVEEVQRPQGQPRPEPVPFVPRSVGSEPPTAAQVFTTQTPLGLPPVAVAPIPAGGASGLGTTRVPYGYTTVASVPYTTVAVATVRGGPSISYQMIRELPAKTEVMVYETAICDGHQRARVGPHEWISLTTAKGKVLAIPGILQGGAIAPTALPATQVMPQAMPMATTLAAVPMAAMPMATTLAAVPVAAMPMATPMGTGAGAVPTAVVPPTGSGMAASSAPQLPVEWEANATPEGRPYYIDHNTGTTHWELPAQAAGAPSLGFTVPPTAQAM